jgi:cell division protein FtsW (lipid II flippase)
MAIPAVPVEVVNIVKGTTTEIINPIIGILFAVALVYFLYGLMMLISSAGNETKRTEGKSHMMWGLVGLVVMVSVYGLLEIGLRTLGVANSDMPNEIPLTL